MEEDIKNMSKEELLEYLEDISQQLDNIALDQIQFAISELQFFKEEYKKLEEEKPNEEEKEVLQAYRNYKKISGSNSWVICNPSTMWSELFIPTSVIEKKIEELENKKDIIDNQTYSFEEVMEAIISGLKELLEEGRR